MTDNSADEPSHSPHPLGEWRTLKVSHKVAMAVVEDIVARALQAGDRLPAEDEMMTRFKVSRTSLREGLRLLETCGVILIRQGQKGGPEIGPLDPGDIARTLALFLRLAGATYRDLFDARLLLEPVMSRIAAERQAPAQMRALRTLIEEVSPETAASVNATNNFHQLVSGLTGNPVLDLLGRALRALYADRIFRGRALPAETLEHCKDAHSAIGEAILAGDGEQAESLMADHMKELANIVDTKAAWFMDEIVSWQP